MAIETTSVGRPPPAVTSTGPDSKQDLGAPRNMSEDDSAFDSSFEESLKATGTEGQPPEVPPAGEAPAGQPDPAKTPPVDPANPPPAPKDPSQPPPPPVAPVPEKDEEIDSIPEPVNVSPDAKANLKKLRDVAKARQIKITETTKQLEEVQGKVKEYEKQLAVPKALTPEVEEELKEARRIRRLFDIEKDPEFKKQFEVPLKTAEEDIIEILKRNDLPANLLEEIKKNGLDSMGDEFWSNPETGKGVFDMLKKGSSAAEKKDAIILEDLLKKRATIGFEKEKAVKAAAIEGSEYLKKRENEGAVKEQQEQQVIQAIVEGWQKKIAWANYKEVPKDATPEVKAQIESDNKFLDETVQRLKIGLNPKTAEERAQTAGAAALLFRLVPELEAEKAARAADKVKFDKDIQALTAELGKFKKTNSTRTAGAAAPTGDAKKANIGDRISMKSEQAVDLAMEEAGI